MVEGGRFKIIVQVLVYPRTFCFIRYLFGLSTNFSIYPLSFWFIHELFHLSAKLDDLTVIRHKYTKMAPHLQQRKHKKTSAISTGHP
ncbi:hypothetical protein B4U37_00490 [Sutcliffiella horikoshii]|uniref:Uncharacterized protein n=1 Tax=Sutcliffiella horikoshii TaxID=79883 RepID=A0ABM6KE32_9BACI|nr:hypothetical protein B4U37_00490 [Sutcliffiella horikoshii]